MSVDDRKGEGPTRVAPGRETRWVRRTPTSPSVGFIESPSWWIANNSQRSEPEEYDGSLKRRHPE